MNGAPIGRGKLFRLLLPALCVAAAAAFGAVPGVGDPAPELSGQTAGGEPVRLADGRGKWVVVHFLPDDDPIALTSQLFALQQAHAPLEQLGAAVMAVSSQPAHALEALRDELDLTLSLVSDPDRAGARAYGAAPGRKAGPVRAMSFLVSPAGTIAFLRRDPDSDTLPSELISALVNLKRVWPGAATR